MMPYATSRNVPSTAGALVVAAVVVVDEDGGRLLITPSKIRTPSIMQRTRKVQYHCERRVKVDDKSVWGMER